MSGDDAEFTGNLGYNGLDSSLNYFTYPPDISTIANSDLAVIFKSLTKKDPKTKEKSLNDLLAKLKESSESLDENSVICWIKLYPKLAIDNAKVVRALAHQIQGSFLKNLGGKGFSKYLKSSMPTWLMGVYDSDKTVSSSAYNSLLENFQGDSAKLEKAWHLFQDPILNLVGSVIVVEQPETLTDPRYTNESEIQLKYDRVLSNSIALLLKVINEDASPGLIEKILLSETIWSKLNSCLKGETMNLNLFRSILTLVLALFSENRNNPAMPENVAKQEALYKLVSKSILKVKFSDKVQPIIYSSVVWPFWKALVELTSFGCRNGYKKNLWNYSSKAAKKLCEYVQLGACDSELSYYELVTSLLSIIKTHNIDVVDFSDSESLEFYVNTLLAQFKRVREAFKPACFDAVMQTTELFDVKNQSLFNEILETAMQGYSTYRIQTNKEKFLNVLKESRSLEQLKGAATVLEKQVESKLSTCDEKKITAYFEFLQALGFSSSIKNIVSFVIQEYEDEDKGEDGERIGIPPVTKVISVYLDFATALPSKVEMFISRLPQVVGQDPSGNSVLLLRKIKKKALLKDNDETAKKLINESFANLELNQPSMIDTFIKRLDIEIDKDSYPQIYAYVCDTSSGDVDAEQIEKILKAGDGAIMQNMISNLSANNHGAFIDSVTRLQKIDAVANLGIEKVIASAWQNVDTSKRFLISLRTHDKEIYEQSMLQYLSSCTLHTNLDGLVDLVKEGPIPYDLLRDSLKSIINQLNPFEIAISNSLASAVYLVSPGTGSFKVEGVVLAKFIVSLSKKKKNTDEANWQALVSTACEYVSDFLFTQKLSGADEAVLFDIISNQTTEPSSSSSSSSTTTTTLEKIAESLTSTDDRESIFFQSRGDDLFAFYAARCLAKLVESACETTSESSFENNINVNYQQLSKQPLQFIAFITGINNFLASPKLDRIRNYVFSELLAIKKDEDILSKGLKWVTMLLPFLNFESKSDLFPGIKLSMVLNQMNDWFDSSIAYDVEFIAIRVQVVRFLGALASNQQQSLPDAYFELTDRLIDENLEMAGDRLDLAYYTLKFYHSMLKSESPIARQDHSKLLEFFVNFQHFDTQVLSLVEQVLERAMLESKFSIPELLPYENALFKILANTRSETALRLSAFYLSQILEHNKQEFVIEFALSKEEGKKATMPPLLTDIASEFKVDDDIDILRYLLTWFLIAIFFKDVTVTIRNDYLNELVSTKNLQTFLYYVFDHVEMNQQFLSTLSVDSIADNVSSAQEFEQLATDFKLLALFIYFRCLQYCGFQVQMWYREIRDKQLQMKVERITTKYLSPTLIKAILEEVENDKGKIQGKEDNLSIKVNRVSNEIKTTYIVDEQKLEMVIKVPRLYPLENVVIEGPARVGVKENKWKAWLLASQKIISLSNGSIIDAIELFCKNINLNFSGFEECAICYSILHQDLSLPSKTCQTCNNKFHAACLYKWFKSSGNSTCPLCRTAFNFKYRN
ncbi:uncharacterized protein LODBEIA_P10380 [Lodderomyces beijingensis]|uniref:E3 ubiquitin-protein ligase listerin n=1 Tax=Lodderomyces beijingensis TaxID=1775926 RepID=A0ABP0ZG47_9ASCO